MNLPCRDLTHLAAIVAANNSRLANNEFFCQSLPSEGEVNGLSLWREYIHFWAFEAHGDVLAIGLHQVCGIKVACPFRGHDGRAISNLGDDDLLAPRDDEGGEDSDEKKSEVTHDALQAGLCQR